MSLKYSQEQLKDIISALDKSNNSAKVEQLGGVEEIAKNLRSDIKNGIRAEERRTNFSDRDAKYGKNIIPEPPKKHICTIFLESLNDTMLIILIIMAVVSIVLQVGVPLSKEIQGHETEKGEFPSYLGWIEGCAILGAVVIVSVVTTLNDWEKERRFRELSAQGNKMTKIKVVRGGKDESVSIEVIYPGDVVNLSHGDRIPADGILIYGYDIRTDESSVTGETKMIKKNEDHPLLRSGTEICEGSGRMLIMAIGKYSLWGAMMLDVTGGDKDDEKDDIPDTFLGKVRYYMVKIAIGCFKGCLEGLLDMYDTLRKCLMPCFKFDHEDEEEGEGEEDVGERAAEDGKKEEEDGEEEDDEAKKKREEEEEKKKEEEAKQKKKEDEEDEDDETPLQKKLDELGKIISVIAFGAAVLAFVILMIGWYINKFVPRITWTFNFTKDELCSDEDWVDNASDAELREFDNCGAISDDLSEIVMFMIFIVTVIVAAVPEGLPLAVTISLAYSVRRMLQDNNLVRKLRSCETMGGATTICSDKTGTLTLNEMRVTKTWIAGKEYFTEKGKKEEEEDEGEGKKKSKDGEDKKKSKKREEEDEEEDEGEDEEDEEEVLLGQAVEEDKEHELSSSDDSDMGENEGGSFIDKVKDTFSKVKEKIESKKDEKKKKKEKKDEGKEPDPMDVLPEKADLSRKVFRLIVEGIASNSNANLLTKKKKERDPKIAKELQKRVQGNKTEGALLLFLFQNLKTHYKPLRKHYEDNNVRQFTFSSEKKRMTTVIRLEDGTVRLYCKGASEVVLRYCTRYLDGDDEEDITPEKREEFGEMIHSLATQGLRTLTLAYRDIHPEEYETVDPSKWDQDEIEKGLILYQIVGIKDPLRKEVYDAVKQCKKAGIIVRMVTGDNVDTARHIAIECEIYDEDKNQLCMEAGVFRKMKDKKIKEILPRLRVLARSRPKDKKRLVRLLMSQKECVGVTGDGTNDAPALKKADVGLSMGLSGTEVAKAASDIVILDDNFASIVKAIIWGRTIYDNIRKFLQFQLTVNVVACTMAVICSITQFIKIKDLDGNDQETTLPFTAVQLLWVNFIMDTLAALALATEKPVKNVLNREPYKKTETFVNWKMWTSILVQSAYQLFVLLFIHYIGIWIKPFQTLMYGDFRTVDWNKGTYPMYEWLEENEVYRPTVKNTMVFNTFVLLQIFNEFNCRRINLEWNICQNICTNYMFLIIFFFTLIIQVIVVQVGCWEPLHLVVGTTGLEWYQWLICLVFAIGCIPVHFVKNLFMNIIDMTCCKLVKKLRKKKTDDGERSRDDVEEEEIEESESDDGEEDDGEAEVKVLFKKDHEMKDMDFDRSDFQDFNADDDEKTGDSIEDEENRVEVGEGSESESSDVE